MIGNGYSGWLVLNLDEVKEGIIIIKLHTWHTMDQSSKTEGWTSVNNGEEDKQRNLRRYSNSHSSFSNKNDEDAFLVVEAADGEPNDRDDRILKFHDIPDLPEGFIFEYAIDGKVTTLKKDEFQKELKDIGRQVEILTLMDDPDFTADSVEVAIRLRGCGRDVTFGLSHIYWA